MLRDITKVEANIPTSYGHMTQHRASCLGEGSTLEAPFGVIKTSYGCLDLVAQQQHDRVENTELRTSENQRVRKPFEPCEDRVELPM